MPGFTAVVRRQLSAEHMLLETVAETYSSLKSLSTDILITNQSDDGSVFHHREKRARAWFTAPDKVRIEQGGKRGGVTVADGTEQHHNFYYGSSPLCSRTGARPRYALPGRFRPEFPHSGGAVFLFDRIAEKVERAETLRVEQTGRNRDAECRVLALTYGSQSPPVYIWVHSGTLLVTRMEFETTQTYAAYGESQKNKLILTYSNTVADEDPSQPHFLFRPACEADSSAL